MRSILTRLCTHCGFLALGLSVVASSPGCKAPTEEAEHHRPEHMPDSYVAAVDRLVELHTEIIDEQPPSGDLDEFDELVDIARWLPELAADSDLGEQPWNRVHTAAGKLQQQLRVVMNEPSAKRRGAYRDQISRESN